MPGRLVEKAQARLATLQYSELTGRLRKKVREMPRQEYMKQWRALNLEFFEAGLLPEGTRAGSVLINVLNHARENKDAKLFERALDAYKKRMTGPRYGRMIDRYEQQLSELKDS